MLQLYKEAMGGSQEMCSAGLRQRGDRLHLDEATGAEALHAWWAVTKVPGLGDRSVSCVWVHCLCLLCLTMLYIISGSTSKSVISLIIRARSPHPFLLRSEI